MAPLGAQYAALDNELARSDFDAVLVDSMFTGAIPLLVSGRRRPPVLVCGVGPLMLSSTDCAPFGIGWQPHPGRDYTRMNRFVRQVLFRADQRRLDAILRGQGLGSAPVFLLDWPVLAERLLQFTVPGFEYPRRDLPPSLVFTGPIPSPSTADPQLPPWWHALHGPERVVHVTQGTWDNDDFDQLLRPALSALGDRSDVLIVASTGGSTASLGPIPANARVCDFVPYSWLLPHVDVMITNGGYGGVQQALGHGVPLIVAGDTADKPEVAARVAYTGAGIDLGARPRPAAVAAAVDRVLRDNSFRDAASKLADEMAQRSPFETIAAVLDEIGRSPSEFPRGVSSNGGVRIGQQGDSR
ncbi:glycosyltransferase [Nocardia sp. NPDC060256]|uniref:glycosyltransferase n=1 Tax=unclassified Nocardia TaxID=2637762 RepID=UPI0036552931